MGHKWSVSKKAATATFESPRLTYSVVFNAEGEAVDGKAVIRPDAPMNEPVKAKPKTVVEKIIHGAIGLTKSTIGIDETPPRQLIQRLAVCQSCEESTPKERAVWNRSCGSMLKVLDANAKTCGCAIGPKASIKAEKCPLGKW